MAVTTWTAGQVLAAQDLNDTLASKVDYALPVNAQTGTTYTFVAADAEKLTTASNAAAVTLTIPPQSSVTWADNTVLRVVNYGAGAVTVDGGSGVTVTNTASTIAQYGAAVAIRTGSDAWTLVPFGGGDLPAAEVSSPAATGQYTDTGVTYDYYTFTASGTLTVDTAGFVEAVIVAGGGGGGASNLASSNGAGGGGAGGYLNYVEGETQSGGGTAIKTVYLPADTYTVTVGAGGAGQTTSSGPPGDNGNNSSLGSFIAVGGGGGMSRNGSSGAASGGSGGGGDSVSAGGAGTSGQGFAGGGPALSTNGSHGGGGASEVGETASTTVGGAGGDGLSSSITGSSVTRAGGGGGGGRSGAAGGAGGAGGGGAGAATGNGTNATANTGGGGGGAGGNQTDGDGGNGGSGVVIVRVAV